MLDNDTNTIKPCQYLFISWLIKHYQSYLLLGITELKRYHLTMSYVSNKIKKHMTNLKPTPTINDSLTVGNSQISPKLLKGMKDFTCAVTQSRVENNMINNDAESIKNDLVEGLLQNADMVSRCIGNIAPVVIILEDEYVN